MRGRGSYCRHVAQVHSAAVGVASSAVFALIRSRRLQLEARSLLPRRRRQVLEAICLLRH